ncbi:unnamed protein product [Cyclocybe aegerita]|uniref:Uncharacterized protein n=1 Tax=Cyclocybe aegerita TaxID=1973307 RepID=A0A8S0Y057_CYCAE|nr:unnamed protein product [Cyclocybe aegerita]
MQHTPVNLPEFAPDDPREFLQYSHPRLHFVALSVLTISTTRLDRFLPPPAVHFSDDRLYLSIFSMVPKVTKTPHKKTAVELRRLNEGVDKGLRTDNRLGVVGRLEEGQTGLLS